MTYVYGSFNFYPFTFVSELVRRQSLRYEIPFAVNRKAQLRDAYITQREPDLCFRWADALDEQGAHYLRSYVLEH